MSHETILLISADAELRTWLHDRVLQSAGYEVVDAVDLASARAQLAARPPQLLLVVLSSQALAELALVAEHELNVPALVITPTRSLEIWEAALTQGASDVLHGR